MAKVVSFNKDVPSLKAQPEPEWQNFDLSVKVVQYYPFGFGKGATVQGIRIRAKGMTKMYEQHFETERAFRLWATWMTETEVRELVEEARSEEVILTMVSFDDEAALIEDGFRRVAGEPLKATPPVPEAVAPSSPRVRRK